MLTKTEIEVCAALGISRSDFEVAVVRRRLRAGKSVSLVDADEIESASGAPAKMQTGFGPRVKIGRGSRAAAPGSTVEQQVCANLGISPRQFAIAKARREAGLSVNAGFKGQQAIDEARDAMEGAPEAGDNASPDDLVSGAQNAIDEYTADPDAGGAYQCLAKAGALIQLALDRIAPAWADRNLGKNK